MRKILLAMVSQAFYWVSLWQLEVLFIQFSFFQQQGFFLPFGFTVEWWFARDLFYALNFLSYLLLFIVVKDMGKGRKIP